MRQIFFLMIALMMCSVGQGKAADNKAKKYLGPVEAVPGGARADHFLFRQWQDMIQPQRFPMLPHSDKLKPLEKKLSADQAKRQRYIMQIAVDKIDLKEEIFDEGYYYFAYSDKDQGDLLIVVPPYYRKCFDDLEKKFDFMQAEVYQLGDLVGRQQVVLEYPRQCLGQLKETGSKLPTATGFGH